MRLVTIVNVITGFALSLCMPFIVNALFTLLGHSSDKLDCVALDISLASKIKGELQLRIIHRDSDA